MFPSCWGFVVVRGVYSLEPVIIDNVVLRRDVSGFEVADQANGFSMYRGHSHELRPSGTRLPLGDLTTGFCEARVQNIGRASPRVEVAKGLAIANGARENFNRRNAGEFVRSMVVQVSSM